MPRLLVDTSEQERSPPMSTEIAVRLEAVTKRYGPVTALDGAGFRLRRGETVALLGPNGAGKSTTVGILLGLLRPDAGRVELLGGSPHEATAAGRVGAMLQQGDLLDGVTVAELVGLVRDLYPAPQPLEETLELAGLAELGGRRIERLSGGQTQRVRYALAIAGAPELLFLDEPTVGMDVQARRAFWRGVRELADRGTTVLLATHYLEEADDNADRIVVLLGGKVVADGPATEIKAGVGSRPVRATVPPGHDGRLRDLPGVRDLQRHGDSVLLESADADATVRALFASGLPVRDIEVSGADLEDAFLALTTNPAEKS
jgi:ABC-2 type transport system ATP-binding protein